MLDANYIFLGPGSPTYAVRNLLGTLALEYLKELHKAGAVLCFASAAASAAGAKVLPVYEIFKAGSDLYWADGLNIFDPFGLELAIVPHWNNTEGGVNLDTSRCYMGRRRMSRLKRLLPASTAVLGIDEHTALIFDLVEGQALVLGKGTITIESRAGETGYSAGQSLPLTELGPYQLPALAPTKLPARARLLEPRGDLAALPAEVARLIGLREQARRVGDWAWADALRQQIVDMGFRIQDTREGPLWRHKDNKDSA
jgi:hypothetical protein